MRLLSEQRKEKHSEWGVWGPTQHRQEMEGSWAALALKYWNTVTNSQFGSASVLGTVGWDSGSVTGPAMFKKFQVCSRRASGRRIARTPQDMKSSGEVDELSLSGQLDRRRKKAKGLVHWRRKIKFSGLRQRQGSSRFSVTSSVYQQEKINSLSASIPICLSWLGRNHDNGFVL